NQAKFRHVAKNPFEIVEQRPMNVAADIDAVGEAAADSLNSALDVFDALAIVGRRYSIFGNEHRHSGFLARITDRGLQRLGIKLVAHLGGLGSLSGRLIFLSDDRAGVGLHADVIVLLRQLEPGPINLGAFLIDVTIRRWRLIVGHGQCQSDWQVAANRLDRRLASFMRDQQVVAASRGIREQKGAEVRGIDLLPYRVAGGGPRFRERAPRPLLGGTLPTTPTAR